MPDSFIAAYSASIVASPAGSSKTLETRGYAVRISGGIEGCEFSADFRAQ